MQSASSVNDASAGASGTAVGDSFQRFPSTHSDLVHDVRYNYFGTRLATCSSDHRVKVWDVDEEGQWTQSSEWKAHNGSIWKVAWGPPEFGQILATCSFDGTVQVWEEGLDERGRKVWLGQATLVDSRLSVTDIEFAPKNVGLRLAACSSDHHVRFYEASDVMNLEHWALVNEFEVKDGCTCISWNMSPFSQQSIAVGDGAGSLSIWEYNSGHRKWFPKYVVRAHPEALHDVSWAPNLGRSYHLIAAASKSKSVSIWRLDDGGLTREASFDDHNAEVWHVEWNVTGTVLASSGDDATIRLWKQDDFVAPAEGRSPWKSIATIVAEEDT